MKPINWNRKNLAPWLSQFGPVKRISIKDPFAASLATAYAVEDLLTGVPTAWVVVNKRSRMKSWTVDGSIYETSVNLGIWKAILDCPREVRLAVCYKGDIYAIPGDVRSTSPRLDTAARKGRYDPSGVVWWPSEMFERVG